MEKTPDTLRGRIQARIDELRLNSRIVSDRSKVPYTTLVGVLKGDQHSVNPGALYALSRTLQTSMEWLAVGAGASSRPDDLQYLLSIDELEMVRVMRVSAKNKRMIAIVVAGLSKDGEPRPSKRPRERRETKIPMLPPSRIQGS